MQPFGTGFSRGCSVILWNFNQIAVHINKQFIPSYRRAVPRGLGVCSSFSHSPVEGHLESFQCGGAMNKV